MFGKLFESVYDGTPLKDCSISKKTQPKASVATITKHILMFGYNIGLLPKELLKLLFKLIPALRKA